MQSNLLAYDIAAINLGPRMVDGRIALDLMLGHDFHTAPEKIRKAWDAATAVFVAEFSRHMNAVYEVIENGEWSDMPATNVMVDKITPPSTDPWPDTIDTNVS